MFIFARLSVVDGSAIGYLRLAGDGRLLTVNLDHLLEGPNRGCSSDKESITLIKEARFCVQKLNALSVGRSHLLSVPVPKGQSSITSLWHPLLVKSPCSFCYFTLS